MSRVLVCGGRGYWDKVHMDHILSQHPISHLIHGAAKGADTLAGKWAESKNIPVTEYPADWNRYGKSAGYIRNHQMLVQGKPDLVIAFPGDKGTANMIKLTKKAGIRLIEVPHG